MRYLHLAVAAAALLSAAWAQQVRPNRRPTYLDRPEVVQQFRQLFQSAQWMRVEEPVSPRSTAHLRTAVLPPLTWLKYSQDADTVPDVASTQPDFAHDTLLGNNAGSDIDPGTSSDCHYSFFDSLYTNGGWAVRFASPGAPAAFSNYLSPPNSTAPDTLFYLGCGVAERYDINPCALQGSGNSLYIKGIAAFFLNNFAVTPRVCTPTTTAPSLEQVADGAYSIIYELRDTVGFQAEVIGDTNSRDWIYPAETLASVSKSINQIRIGWITSAGQCVSQVYNRLERYDYAYFSTPIEIDAPHSYFAAVKFELYNPAVDAINDTLFLLIGPAYSDGALCFTGDTNTIGRNYLLTPGYRQSDATWIYPDEWYPQYFIFSGRGYDLNFLLHPIIYEAQGSSGGVSSANCQSTGQVVRSGTQGFGLPYPNPAVECVHLQLTTPAATQGMFLLYTVDGQLVQEWSRSVPAGESIVALDLPAVPAGSYILHARTPYGVASFWVSVVK